VLKSIFNAYAAGSFSAAAEANLEMDMEEFHDFVIDANVCTEFYGFETIGGQFTKANAGSNDAVLELHEFLTMLVRIAFYRANPHYGLQKGFDGKRDERSTRYSEAAMERKTGRADEFTEDDTPLPGCLTKMLTDFVLPNARQEHHAKEFGETTLLSAEVQAALAAKQDAIATFYEMASEGRPFLEAQQYVDALSSKLLFSDLKLEGFSVRLTEPQAKAAFYASASSPASGLLPEELPACIARTGCDKYKHVGAMQPAAKVAGFLTNLLTEYDEEDVVLEATGGAPVAGKHDKPKGPQYSADGFLLSDKEEVRITGIASGTAAMLMPDERTMDEREKFETKGYNASRDNIMMSQGATMADESLTGGLHSAYDPDGQRKGPAGHLTDDDLDDKNAAARLASSAKY